MSTPVSSLFNVPKDFSPKSFWQRPEGKPGMILAGGGIAAIVFFAWGTVVPFVLATIQDTFWLVTYSVVTFGMVDVLFGITGPGKRLHNVVRNVFQSLARNIARLYTEVDPIGIMRNTLADMKEDFRGLLDTISKLAGSDETLRRKIEKQRAMIEKLGSEADVAKGMATKAKSVLDKERFTLQSETDLQKAGMLMTGVDQLTSLAKDTEDMLEVFRRWSQTSDAKIQRFEFKTNFLADQRSIILEAKSSLSFGQRLLRGRPEQLEMVDMAVEYLESEASQTRGEIREFSRYADQLASGDEIEGSAAALEAQRRLGEFKKKRAASDTASATPDPVDAEPLPMGQGQARSDDYGKMFK